MKRVSVALIAGALFGLGLSISGMTQPAKVLNFLDLAGAWDPSLAVVMIGALAISAPGFAWVRRRAGAATDAPSAAIDARLLIGSALFGIGWGIAGYCPGPALANLTASTDVGWFLIAMLLGSWATRAWLRRGAGA